MLFKKDELRLLWPFYSAYLVLGLSAIILPYMIIYFQGLGFSYLQLTMIIILMRLGKVLFEIPTGVVADVYSRKYSMLIGTFIVGVSVLLIPFFDGFYMLCFLMFLAGIGMSFTSGAEEAWMIDNLAAYKRKDLQHELFIKLQVMINIGFILSPLLGVFLVKNYSLKLLWIIFGVSYLSCIFLLVWAEEKYVPKREKFFVGLKNTWKKSKEGFQYVKKNETVFLLILASVFATFLYLGNNGQQPLLVQYSLPLYALGYVYAAMGFFSIFASFMSRWFAKGNIKRAIVIIWFLRILAFSLVIFIFQPHFLVLAFILLFHDFITSISEPLLQTYLHQHLKKEIRATIVSLKSMASNIGSIVVGIVGGILMDIYGPQAIIGLGGVLGVFALATYMKLKD